jgi:hypothetical protein
MALVENLRGLGRFWSMHSNHASQAPARAQLLSLLNDSALSGKRNKKFDLLTNFCVFGHAGAIFMVLFGGRCTAAAPEGTPRPEGKGSVWHEVKENGWTAAGRHPRGFTTLS